MLAAEKLSPLNVRVRNTLSEFYFDQRRLPEAEAEARRSLEIEPTTQGNWDLGLAEWLKGDRPAAERAFLGALALTPSGRAHFMLGLFYMDSARPADALREYRAGLQLTPPTLTLSLMFRNWNGKARNTDSLRPDRVGRGHVCEVIDGTIGFNYSLRRLGATGSAWSASERAR